MGTLPPKFNFLENEEFSDRLEFGVGIPPCPGTMLLLL